MNIIQIAETLNEKAKNHRIGEIQTIRYKMGRQDKNAIQRLFYISPKTLEYWGNWVLLFGGIKEFLFCIHLDKANRLWYGLSLPLKDKGMFGFFNKKNLMNYVSSINSLIKNSPDLFSEYSMWYEIKEGISNVSKAGKILPEQLEDSGAVFIGNSIEIEKLDYEQILNTFDKMLEIYIKVNTGNSDSTYESLKNYEPPAKPKQIRKWSNEAIRYTEDNLCDLTFGVDRETKIVCLEREAGTFGHIELNDALSKTYRVIDKDGNVEFFSNVHDLTNASWVLD
jgi:hypothetical protein